MTLLTSCKTENYLPKNFNETVHYEVIFKDKERKVKRLRQSYHVFKGKDNKIVLLKNDGELMSFNVRKTGIEIQSNHYTENQNMEKIQVNKKTYLPFPIKIDIAGMKKIKQL